MTRRSSPVWHPFTQHGLAPAPLEARSAEGAYITLADGRRLFDGISSWWVVTHGHRHPRIMAAMKEEIDRLDQVIFAGLTHEAAEEVANGLVAVAPEGLAHVFFSDSGSTSVEVGIKMAFGYWANRGAPRTRIAAMQHGYHGDTVGTMSAGERGVFNASYAPLLFDVSRIPFPAAGREQEAIDALDAACRGEAVAAFVVEPLLLGAGGMLAYSPHVLAELHRVCRSHGVLFIADEVMTGFGRTGSLFACNQAGIAPDILCLAKGITGGAVPLAATLATRAIFEAHYATDRAKTFFHSSSYTANPIACRAAAANLAIWRDEPVATRIAALAGLQEERLSRVAADSRFVNPRRIGTIAALDLDVPAAGYFAGVGPALMAHFLARGVLLRPLGNTIYVMPPYCTTAADLDLVYEVIAEAPGALL